MISGNYCLTKHVSLECFPEGQQEGKDEWEKQIGKHI